MSSPMLAKQLGINCSTVNDASHFFADRMKHARVFGPPGLPYSNQGGPALDAAGWPTGDTGFIISTGSTMQEISGRYTLHLTGKIDQFSTYVTPSTFSNSYDVSTNTTTIVCDVPATGNNSLSVYVVFQGTHRTANSPANTGFTNLQIMAPIAPGALVSYDRTEIFERRLLEVMNAVSIFRTMDLMIVNAYGDVPFDWTIRKLPSDPSQASGGGPGVAYEFIIMLANAQPVPQNVWFSLPDTATDDFYRNFALMIKYGTDGVNPYTGPPGSTGSNPQPASGPVYPALKGKPAFEHSNEVWNDSFGSTQTGRSRSNGVARAKAHPEQIAWDGQTYDVYLGYREYGLRVLNMRNVMGSVFGDSTFNQDFFIIQSNQLGNGPYLTMAIEAIQHNDSRPLNQVVSKIGGQWYASWNVVDASATVDQVYAGGIRWYPYTPLERAIVSPYGIGQSGYEGNLNQGDGDGGIPTNAVTIGIDADHRMTPVFTQLLLQRLAEGIDWLMVYDTDLGPYGVAPVNDATTPKMVAMKQVKAWLDAGTLPAPTASAVTTPVPDHTIAQPADWDFETATLGTASNAYAYNPLGTPWTYESSAGVSGNLSVFTQNNDNTPSGQQVGFLQNTGSISQNIAGWKAGSYTISLLAALRASSSFPTQSFHVLIDNNIVDTIQPASVSYALYTTAAFQVTAGSHTITFQGINTNGDYTVFIDAVVIANAGVISPTPTATGVGGARLGRLLRRRS